MAKVPNIQDHQFLQRLLGILLSGAYNVALPEVAQASIQLAEALEIETLDDYVGRLTIPHYWAIYLHDGRGPFGPVRKRVLVWFRDPKDDPRLLGGRYPVRASQINELTRQQYLEGQAKNNRARAAGVPEWLLPMQVRKQVGPALGQPFFRNDGGMAPFSREGRGVAGLAALDHIRGRLKTAIRVKKKTIHVQL